MAKMIIRTEHAKPLRWFQTALLALLLSSAVVYSMQDSQILYCDIIALSGSNPPDRFAVSNDGTMVVVARDNASLQVWEKSGLKWKSSPTFREKGVFRKLNNLHPSYDKVRHITISADKKYFVVIYPSSTIIWQKEGGNWNTAQTIIMNSGKNAQSYFLNNDKHMIICSAGTDRIDIAKGFVTFDSPRPKSYKFKSKTSAIIYENRRGIWAPIQTIPGEKFDSAFCSLDGQRAVFSGPGRDEISAHNTIKIWQNKNERWVLADEFRAEDLIDDIALSPGGKNILACNTLKVISLKKINGEWSRTQVLKDLEAADMSSSGPILVSALSRTGKLAATAVWSDNAFKTVRENHKISIWKHDGNNWSVVKTLYNDNIIAATDIRFSDNGGYLIVSGAGNSDHSAYKRILNIWDMREVLGEK